MFHTASVQHQNRSRKIIIIMQNLKRTFLQLLWIFRSRPLKKISHFTQGSQSTNHVFIFVRSSKLVSVNHSKKKLKRIFCLSSNFCWPALGVLMKGVPGGQIIPNCQHPPARIQKAIYKFYISGMGTLLNDDVKNLFLLLCW